MKKEVEIKIPAKRASVAKKTKILCDICGASAERENYGYGGGVCSLCGRDICKKHKDYDPHGWDDYPDSFCTVCYELVFTKYWKEHEAIEEEFERKQKELDAKIQKESLSHIDMKH